MQPPADATVLALDLGGTQVRAALVRPDGARIGRAAAPTPVVDARRRSLRHASARCSWHARTLRAKTQLRCVDWWE